MEGFDEAVERQGVGDAPVPPDHGVGRGHGVQDRLLRRLGAAELEDRLALFARLAGALDAYVVEPTDDRLLLLRAQATASVDATTSDWRPHAHGGLDVLPVTGDHYTILAPPHVEVVAERIASAARQAAAPRGARRLNRG